MWSLEEFEQVCLGVVSSEKTKDPVHTEEFLHSSFCKANAKNFGLLSAKCHGHHVEMLSEVTGNLWEIANVSHTEVYSVTVSKKCEKKVEQRRRKFRTASSTMFLSFSNDEGGKCELWTAFCRQTARRTHQSSMDSSFNFWGKCVVHRVLFLWLGKYSSVLVAPIWLLHAPFQAVQPTCCSMLPDGAHLSSKRGDLTNGPLTRVRLLLTPSRRFRLKTPITTAKYLHGHISLQWTSNQVWQNAGGPEFCLVWSSGWWWRPGFRGQTLGCRFALLLAWTFVVSVFPLLLKLLTSYVRTQTIGLVW